MEEDAGGRMLVSADILFGYENKLKHKKTTRVKMSFFLAHS